MMLRPMSTSARVFILLAVFDFLAGGCTFRAGDRVYEPGLGEAVTSPASTAATPNPPSPEPVAFRPAAEDETRIGNLLTMARQSILDGQARDAVDQLMEAQTVTGWAQSPRAPEILFWLGHSYEQLDETVAAISAYRRAATLFGDTPYGARSRARLSQLIDSEDNSDRPVDSDGSSLE